MSGRGLIWVRVIWVRATYMTDPASTGEPATYMTDPASTGEPATYITDPASPGEPATEPVVVY